MHGKYKEASQVETVALLSFPFLFSFFVFSFLSPKSEPLLLFINGGTRERLGRSSPRVSLLFPLSSLLFPRRLLQCPSESYFKQTDLFCWTCESHA